MSATRSPQQPQQGACMYSAQGELQCGAAATSTAVVRGMYGDLPVASYAPYAAAIVQQYERSAAPTGVCPSAAALPSPAPNAKVPAAVPQQQKGASQQPLHEGFFPMNLPMGMEAQLPF